jgi:hypothetical protein
METAGGGCKGIRVPPGEQLSHCFAQKAALRETGIPEHGGSRSGQ